MLFDPLGDCHLARVFLYPAIPGHIWSQDLNYPSKSGDIDVVSFQYDVNVRQRVPQVSVRDYDARAYSLFTPHALLF